MRICVYCASSARIDQAYFDATEILAKDFVKNKVDVVYGGGAIGLMGKLADTIIENGGNIKGIMPKFMNEVEWAHKKVSDFEFTETMHERKSKFLVNIDGLVALPGGCGTLEELFEAITLKRLGLFTKPIIILNTNAYYDPLSTMLDQMINENFLKREHSQMWTIVDHPKDVLPAIKTATPWNSDAIHFANLK